jgi:hypothetical protein
VLLHYLSGNVVNINASGLFELLVCLVDVHGKNIFLVLIYQLKHLAISRQLPGGKHTLCQFFLIADS